MKNELISQYRSCIRMLTESIDKCPDELWEDGDNYENAYWRISYHALFYTALYLAESDAHFIPWVKHQPNYNSLGSLNFDQQPVTINSSYTKADLLAYAGEIFDNLPASITENMEASSGFEWIPMNKFQLHIYNIRHIQHHTGQLIERLHQNGIKGILWRGMDR